MTKHIFLYSSYFLIVYAALLSCKKYDNPETKIIYVPDYLKTMVPYSDSQHIKFIGSNSDTLNILVFKKSTIINDNTCLYCTQPQKIEVISVKLTDMDKPSSNNLLAEFTLKPPATTNNSTIELYLHSPIEQYISPRYQFNLKISEYFSSFDCSQSNYDCNTFYINGIVYSGAVEIALSPQYPALNEIIKILYTKNNGIVRFTFKNGINYIIK